MKKVSISEAREQFSAVVKLAKQGKDDVIIQNRGQPEAVIISYADYEMLQEARENERLKKAIQALHEIAAEVGNNTQMTQQEADQLADEITREAVGRMVEKGDVRIQE